MTDYSELKKLAEKASPGPWWIDSHGMTMMSMPKLEVVFNHPAQSIAVRNEETGNLSHWRNDWDASYIATANPKTILALIAEVEALRKDSDRLDYLENLSRASYTGMSIVKGESKGSLELMWFHNRAESKPDLRQAIDAAMSKES